MDKQVVEFLRKYRKESLTGILGLFVVGIISLILSLGGAPYSTLYNGLTEKDTYTITEQLMKEGIPYKIEGLGRIEVPSERIYEARMKIAGSGTGPSDGKGLELFDSSSTLTSSVFSNDVNLQRAMQTELQRTIAFMPKIQAARVHLVIPKHSAFLKKNKEAKASVMLQVTGGNRLSGETVAAIQNLLSGSIPNLTQDNVRVIDSKGRLLSQNDGGEEMGFARNIADMGDIRENKIKANLTEMLEGVVGVGQALVQVSVKLNRENIKETTKSYDLEQQVEVSKLTVKDRISDSTGQGGQVGVDSVTPNTRQQAPGKTNFHDEEKVNYDTGQTIQDITKPAGTIERITVAVIVGDKVTIGEDSSQTITPRTEEELDNLKLLVENAIGFDSERGDSVEVQSMPIITNNIEPKSDVMSMVMSQFNLSDLIKWGIVLILAGIIGWFVLKPISRQINIGNSDKNNSKNSKESESLEFSASNENKYVSEVKKAVNIEPDRAEKVVNEWLDEAGNL